MKIIDMRNSDVANQLYILNWSNVDDEEDPFNDTTISYNGKVYYLTQIYGGWSIAKNPANHESLLIDCLGEKALRTLHEERMGREGNNGLIDVLENEESEIDD